MNTYAAAYAHIVNRLSNDPDVRSRVGERIYTGTAPENPVYPLILIQSYSADDIYYIGHDRIGANVTVSVRVVDEGYSLAEMMPLATALDAALQASGSASTAFGDVAQCVRTSETDLTENISGRTWRYIGGLYDLLITAPDSARTLPTNGPDKEQQNGHTSIRQPEGAMGRGDRQRRRRTR